MIVVDNYILLRSSASPCALASVVVVVVVVVVVIVADLDGVSLVLDSS